MTLKRPLILVPAVIALVAVTVIAVVLIGARTGMARRMIAGWVSESAGLPVTIDALRVGFLPRPSFTIGGLAIAQPPGFGRKPIVEVGQIRASVPWGSMFDPSSIEILSISDVTARLEVASTGEANWSRLGVTAGEAGVEPANPAWSIDKLDLERGTVEYEDRVADTRWQLTAITVAATNLAPSEPFPVDLRFGGIFGPNTIHYAVKGQARLDLEVGIYEANDLDFRGWAGGDPLPLAGVELTGGMKRAVFESATGVATLDDGSFRFAEIPGEFSGTVDLDEPELEAEFRLTTGAFEPRVSAIILGHPLPATTDPRVFGSLQLALQGRMREDEIALDPLSGRLDDTNFEGRVVPGRRLIRATLDQIDVNRYLAPEIKGALKKKATLEAAVAELAEFDIDAEIRIEDARVAGARFRNTVIRVERNGDTP